MPKVGGKRRKSRTHKEIEPEEEDPRCFVVRRGQAPKQIKQLVHDYREVMYPNTSMQLQDGEKTKIKDLIKAAQFYRIQHMVFMTSTKKNSYLRFIKNPRGPTFTFRIVSYSNSNETLNAQRKFKSFSRIFCPPLLIMNGFNQDVLFKDEKAPKPEHLKLVGSMIQGMFPVLKASVASFKTQKRAVLFVHKDDKIYMRHYHISYNIKGIDKKMKKIIKANKSLNLSNYNSFADYLQNANIQTDSEQSDLEEIEQVNQKDEKSKMSVRLHEVGPRLTLKLYKIEEGFLNGTVLYNRVVSKTKKAQERLRKVQRRRILLKSKRREEQQQNVEKKQQQKQDIQQYDQKEKKIKQQ